MGGSSSRDSSVTTGPARTLLRPPRRDDTLPSPRSEPDLRADESRTPCPPSVPGKRKREGPSSRRLSNGHSHGSLPDLLPPAAGRGKVAVPTGNANPHEMEDDYVVPSVFTWTSGGQDVSVAGAWDDWACKTPMYKNGNNHIALIYIPCGHYQFKYYVDENWQCAPNLPTRTDEHGNTNNIVDIPTQIEFDTSSAIDDPGPPSPISTYDQASMAEYSTDPPYLPPHLEARSLKPLPEDISPYIAAMSKPSSAPSTPLTPRPSLPGAPPPFTAGTSYRPFFSHVFIDHLYHAQPNVFDDDVQCLSQTSRVRGKVINTVFVTRRSKQQPDRPVENGFGH